MRKILLLSSVFLSVFTSLLIARDYRSHRSEAFFMPQYISGKQFDFKDHTSVDISSRGGFGIGFGYNFTENFEIAGIFSSTNSSYLTTIKNNDGTLEKMSRNLYTSSMSAEATYNIFDDEFTPFISANFGFTYVDTGIHIEGNPGYCYWDPWWGYICYDNTYTSTELSYGATVGARYDFRDTLYLKGGVGMQYLDLKSDNTPFFTTYTITIGGRF